MAYFYKQRKGSVGAFWRNDPSIAGYWPLNGDVQDYSGNGNHLTLGGSATVLSGSHVGKGFLRGGLWNPSTTATSEGARLSSGASMSSVVLPTFSCIVWFRIASLPTTTTELFVCGFAQATPFATNQFFLDINGNSGIGGSVDWRIAMSSGNDTDFATTDGSGVAIHGQGSYTDNKWHCAVLTGSGQGGVGISYIDGMPLQQLSIVGTGSWGNSPTVIVIGEDFQGTPLRSLQGGQVQEVAVFNRVLSPTEINAYWRWATSPANLAFFEWLKAGTAFLMSLTEGAVGTDTILKTLQRSISEGAIGTDTLVPQKVKPATLTEGATGTDSILKSITRILSDGAIGTDTFIRQTVRVLSEGAIGTDTFLRSFAVLLMEGITGTEILKKLLNGSDVIWSHIAKSANATFTKVTKSADSVWTHLTKG